MNITRLNITPDYLDGFAFSWELDASQPPRAGTTYTVQRGHTHNGPWVDISPPITGAYFWLGDGERVVHTKEPILYYRVKAVSGNTEVYSSVVQPYGDVTSKREFLIICNMRRQEMIQQRNLGGTECKVFVRAMFGPACTSCRDFVTGRSARQDCLTCFGTGIEPGYHGPYDTYARFTATRIQKGLGEQKYVTESSGYVLRMLGLPPLKKDDIVVDTERNRRYLVNAVYNAVEIRRVPVIQNVTVMEIPSSSPYYRIEV